MRGRFKHSGHPIAPRTGRGLKFRVACSISLAVLAIFSWACESPPRFTYANGTDSQGNPAPQHFFVLPLNVAVPIPPGLEGTTDDVFSAVASYLRKRGDSIETISPKAAFEQWRSSIAEVAASDTRKHDFETGMQEFVERARESRSFDALIMPAMVLRETELRKRMVKWDGVIRKYHIVNLSEEAKKRKIAGSISPEFSGVSLHVTVFGANGEMIFQGYGGLDLAHDLDMDGAERTMRARFSLKSELMKNHKYLREGIARAFDPYLPRS